MSRLRIYKLNIDPQFRFLKYPISSTDSDFMEENIFDNGCKEPILIWDKTIIDGHKRYDICRRWRIPFRVKDITFTSRQEAIKWICSEQLLRKDLPEPMKKYLIGKRYEVEKDIQSQYALRHVTQSLSNEETQYPPGIIYSTANAIGKEYSLSHNTVYKYGAYSQALDIIAEKNRFITKKILSAEVIISHQNVLELSRFSPEDIRLLHDAFDSPENPHITLPELRHEVFWKKNQSRPSSHRPLSTPAPAAGETPAIKQMPTYDPDAEVSSLTLTIPSWISSITRTHSVADFPKVSKEARNKLQIQLLSLRGTIDTVLQTIKEARHE